MEQRIGSCSICGGDVYAHRGAWFAVVPPPPPHCRSCGATAREDTIEMVRAPRPKNDYLWKDTSGTNTEEESAYPNQDI